MRGRSAPLTRTPLRRRSAKRARLQRQWNAITARKIAAGMTCEMRIDGVCLTTPTQGHHRLPVGRGGKWTEANHALSCDACNLFAHRNEFDPRVAGLVLRSGGVS